MLNSVALAITGLGALISAVAGVVLVVRQVRGKDRRAADEEIRELSAMLDEARHEVVECRRREYALRVWLAERGLEPPVW